MISALTLAATVVLSGNALPPRCAPPVEGAYDDELRALYESGVDYATFLDEAQRRRDLWVSNTQRASVPDALRARASAVRGTWYLLAVSIDGCSDSVNTIPYIARLAELVDGLELRIVDSTVGRPLMMAHPTRDDRAATPTVLLLDAAWNEVGCFIERPDPLQTWYQANKSSLDSDELFERKMAWYDEDAGATTVREIVEMLEAASAGKPICRG
jgi:hypothetical protein